MILPLPYLIFFITSGLIIFSLIFFSRGILIFLTIMCLALTQSYLEPIRSFTMNLRWVFLILFSFYSFGDIFLGKTVRRIKYFDFIAVFLIMYAFISSLYSPYPVLTLQRATTILLLYISVFWIIWKYAYNRGPEMVVYIILRALALLFAVSYLAMFINPVKAFMLGRFQGILLNPNGLGTIIATLIPLSLWQFLETKKKAALLLFLAMLAGVFLCASRGAINATLIGLGYFVYAKSRKQRPLLFFIFMAFIFILFWIIDTLAQQLFLRYIRIETLPTGAGRFEVWPIAIRLIAEKPILGYGFGVEEKLFALKRIALREHPGGYFHNSYLGIMLQLGIPGFVIFFGPLFILLFKELFSKFDAKISSLRYALRGCLLAGLACAIFESWVYSVGNAQAFPFWITVMLLVFYHYQDKETNIPVEST